MQMANIPKSICPTLEKICRGFIWGNKLEKRQVHLINWNQFCEPKIFEGVGVSKMQPMNKALIMKLC